MFDAANKRTRNYMMMMMIVNMQGAQNIRGKAVLVVYFVLYI